MRLVVLGLLLTLTACGGQKEQVRLLTPAQQVEFASSASQAMGGGPITSLDEFPEFRDYMKAAEAVCTLDDHNLSKFIVEEYRARRPQTASVDAMYLCPDRRPHVDKLIDHVVKVCDATDPNALGKSDRDLYAAGC